MLKAPVRALLGLLLSLALLSPLTGSAAGPSWAQLTVAQQTALRPLARDWAQIDDVRRQKWLEIAARFDRMSPAEQARVQERMRAWAELSPGERGQARFNFREAQRLRPEARQSDWEAYLQLSEEDRRRLARSAPPTVAEPASPGQRRIRKDADPEAGGPRARVVAPTLVQAPQGVSTRPITQAPSPPLHQQPGLPKIATSPDFIDPATLLPQRGPQGAAGTPERAAPARRP